MRSPASFSLCSTRICMRLSASAQIISGVFCKLVGRVLSARDRCSLYARAEFQCAAHTSILHWCNGSGDAQCLSLAVCACALPSAHLYLCALHIYTYIRWSRPPHLAHPHSLIVAEGGNTTQQLEMQTYMHRTETLGHSFIKAALKKKIGQSYGSL